MVPLCILPFEDLQHCEDTVMEQVSEEKFSVWNQYLALDHPLPTRKGVQARKISVCEEDISRDSIGAALSKKSSICDENDQKKKKDASILNDGIPACAHDSSAEKKRD